MSKWDFFKNLFTQPKAALSGALEELLRSYYGQSNSASGIAVNSDTAMRLITVQNCIRVRTATIAQLPCQVMQKSAGIRKKAEDFYLYELLHDQPNSWMSAAEFWAMVEAYVCLRGNFLAFKSGLPGRPVKELLPISWDRVHKIEQKEDYSIVYEIQMNNGNIVPFPQERLFHIRGLLTLDGFTGVNPIQYARETMGNGLAQVKHLGNFFGKGLRPGAIIKHPLPLSSPAHSNLKKNLKEKYSGLGNSWDMMLLDEGMDISFPDIKLVDQQYLELMKMNEAQICGLFRVPLMLAQAGDKTPTYASAEQFWINYLTIGVNGDVRNYEQAIRRDLLTPEERRQYYARFETRALLRSAFKDQMEGFQVAVNTEIMNPNEVRDLLDMNPYDGGDIYKTRTSTTKDSPANQSANDQGGKNK